MITSPLLAIDFYKAGHHRQYPQGTEKVYSNLTARSSRFANIPNTYRDGVVFFGLNYFIKKFLIDHWTINFFEPPEEEVVPEYKGLLDACLGGDNSVDHIAALHRLGRLPITIRAVPEGTLVPVGVPMMTIENTHPSAFWLTNYLETALSAYLWKPIVSATTARFYRRVCEESAAQTGFDAHLDFQCHDFSMRGMSGVEDAALSGAAHLIFFKGTDSVPAIDLLRRYYGADLSRELIGASVPATEHSVMSMGGPDGEFDTFRRLITEIYPSGVVSIVSDTWDFWQVLTDYLPRLKDEIIARDGKVVIRPDSGDPVKIICGDPDARPGSPEFHGAVSCLAQTFGAETLPSAYLRLNPKVGLIYGDSITPERARQIIMLLMMKGYSPDCVVFGVGSYTYQMVTRDTWGLAVKATYGVVNGEPRQIFKAPKTDGGMKKSLRGMVSVRQGADGRLYVIDGLSAPDPNSLLEPVFEDGRLVSEPTLQRIRETARSWM